jgi:hypothetical protein
MTEKKGKKRLLITIGSLGVFLFLAAWGTGVMVRYSSTNPSICEQCHPDYKNHWVESNGHPADETSCHECHYRKPQHLFKGGNPVGNLRDWVVPAEYVADDQVTSQLCLDCHEDVLELGYSVKKKVIEFNHRVHHSEGLECMDCHRSTGHTPMKNSTNRPGIRECLNCHWKEFQGPPKNMKCLNCHEVMLLPGRLLQSPGDRILKEETDD